MAKILDFKNDYSGLDTEKAREYIKLYGYNSDTKLDEKTKGYNPLKAFFNLRFLLLIGAAALCFINCLAVDDAIYPILTGSALLLLSGVFAATEIVKNTGCDKYFFELKNRSRTEYRVVRDNETIYLRKEQLVPDDIIVLSEGESVPADAHLLEIRDLTVDESVFTGDKTPAEKITGADSLNEEIKKSCIYRGTRIVSGELVARVTGTGVDTRFFKTYGAPKETDEYYTAFEKAVLRISNMMTAVSAVMLVFCALFHFTKINIFDENVIVNTVYNTLYPAVAFALCFIPAETASMVRLYYIKGAMKLDERNAAIKSLQSIEYINAATCILIDKSGMVTKNRMEVADALTANSTMMTNISVLACKKSPDDIIDQAIVLHSTFEGVDAAGLHENELIREYPFSESEGAAGNLWNLNGTRLLCIKGAPEKLMPLCDVPVDMLYNVQNKQVSYGQQGYVVLAVAFAQLPEDAEIPEKISDAHYSFMGLLAFENQTRDYIPAAVRNCQRAGIRVIMTTGDGPETSLAVAKKIGIKGDNVVTGDMLMSDEPLDLKNTGVFARITQDMKPLIIKKLQEAGEVVAITGESASDSNLLELADVGISVANSVSGAAFEACDVVMSDDSFESITDVLRIARQAHLNVKRCISLVLTSVIALIIFAVFNLIIGTEFIISPVLGAILSILVVPAISFMFYDNTADFRGFMAPSGYIGKGILSKTFFIRPFVQAIGIAAAELIFYVISSGYGTKTAETVAGLADQSRSCFLIIFVIGLLLSGWVSLSDKSVISAMRSGQSFAHLIGVIVIACSLAIVFIPFVNGAFGFGSPDILTIVIAVIVTILFQLPAELIKLQKKNR